ncbi:MAG TPA: ABC transporter substrate-binding protein [Acidimicrobiia bacterium]|nr:ABC transporter substrate-binding protein [Acidimicrobiia bacterium]
MARTRLHGLLALVCALSTGGCAVSSSRASAGAQAGKSAGQPVANSGAGQQVSGDAVLLGIAVAETSNVALLGQEEVIGARIAERLLNADGGVNGRPVKLLFQDTGGDEIGAINAFQAVINAGVLGIVGPTLSQQAFAADTRADAAGVPVLGPSNTAKGIPQIGKFIGRVSAGVDVVAPLAVEQALKLNPEIKRVAVAYAQNDAFSASETKIFQATVQKKGLDLALVQRFQTSDTDFTSQVTNIVGSRPQLVIVSGLAADGGNLIRQLRELGYKGLVIGGNGLNTTNVLPVCGRFCEGILIAQAYSPAVDNPINQRFVEAYNKQTGKQPPQFTAQTFTGVQVFVDALRRLDKTKRLETMDLRTLRAELNNAVLAGSYETPLGQIGFDPEGEIKQQKFYVAQIKMDAGAKSGRFVLTN